MLDSSFLFTRHELLRNSHKNYKWFILNKPTNSHTHTHTHTCRWKVIFLMCLLHHHHHHTAAHQISLNFSLINWFAPHSNDLFTHLCYVSRKHKSTPVEFLRYLYAKSLEGVWIINKRRMRVNKLPIWYISFGFFYLPRHFHYFFLFDVKFYSVS